MAPWLPGSHNGHSGKTLSVTVLIPKSPFFPEQEIIQRGYPAYITSAGWLGYSDQQLHDLCQKYLKAGWTRWVEELVVWYATLVNCTLKIRKYVYKVLVLP